MSASREKKERKNLIADQPEGAKKNKEQKSKTALYVTLLSVAVVVVVFLFLLLNGVFHRVLPAVSVGNVPVSVAEYNFNFWSNYRYVMPQYAESFGMELTDETIDEIAMGDMTWRDYFHDFTQQGLVDIISRAESAKAEGITLTEDETATIENFIDSVRQSASHYSQSVNTFLTSQYGKGVNEDVIRTAVERSILAEKWTTVRQEANEEMTDDQVQAYYNENKKLYDTATYHLFSVSPDTVDEALEGEERTAALIAAQEKAKKTAEDFLAAITDEASFAKEVQKVVPDDKKEQYNDPNATVVSAEYTSISPPQLGDWLFDPARKYGDKTLIENIDEDLEYFNTYYVPYFIKTEAPKSKIEPSVRHILIKDNHDPTYGADSNRTEEEAKALADDILNEWKTGDATEESFGELAKQYTEDTASKENGGLYEEIYEGQMVTAFDEWCFDPARKVGDTGIVQSEYGYHIMYFVDQGFISEFEVLREDTMSIKYSMEQQAARDRYPLTKTAWFFMA